MALAPCQPVTKKGIVQARYLVLDTGLEMVYNYRGIG